MAGTPRMTTQITNRLTSLVPAYLPGGVYNNRPISQDTTPDAYEAVPPYRLRTAAIVTDGTDSGDPIGPDASYHSFPQIWFYALRTDSGKDAIANAWDQAFGALHNWQFATPNGTRASVQVIGRGPVLDDPEDSKRLFGTMRLQVTSLWRRIGA